MVIGQDPATHETICRRILVGEAGQRAQGLLAKLGITRSYVLINAFLYSRVRAGGGSRHIDDEPITAYRNRWLDRLAARNDVQAILSLGQLADRAYQQWKVTPNGAACAAAYANVVHPTYPESASRAGSITKAEAFERLCTSWNTALTALRPHVTPDGAASVDLYGTTITDEDLAPIPPEDLPAGTAGVDALARRVGRAHRRRRPAQAGDDHRHRAACAVHVAPGDLTVVVHPPSARYVLEGRVVPMGGRRAVTDGAVYVDEGVIEHVRPRSAQLPDAKYRGATRIRTGGSIYPGFIELHNHLAYNVMPLWDVPTRYTNNGQWRGTEPYTRRITKPSQVLGQVDGVAQALVRVTEGRALFGGTTCSQGLTLANAGGVTKLYAGLLRNPEAPDDPRLPKAGTNIANPDTGGAAATWTS